MRGDESRQVAGSRRDVEPDWRGKHTGGSHSQRAKAKVTLTEAELPQRAIAAEAWVRVDKPLRWGGIAGAIQDNGSFERGWLLGRQKKVRINAEVESKPAKLDTLRKPHTDAPACFLL